MKFKRPAVVGVLLTPTEYWALKDCVTNEGSVVEKKKEEVVYKVVNKQARESIVVGRYSTKRDI